jgi:hypothetical protein
LADVTVISVSWHSGDLLVVLYLIGNATNPYLEKFDYIWVIFLPVALINFWLLGKNSPGERSFNGEVMRLGREGA